MVDTSQANFLAILRVANHFLELVSSQAESMFDLMAKRSQQMLFLAMPRWGLL